MEKERVQLYNSNEIKNIKNENPENFSDSSDDDAILKFYKNHDHNRNRSDFIRDRSRFFENNILCSNTSISAASTSSNTDSNSSSSYMKISYSVNSQDEYDFALRSIEKSGKNVNFVKQMRLKFEKLCEDKEFRQTPKLYNKIYEWTNPKEMNIDEVRSEDEAEEIPECEIMEKKIHFESENSCDEDDDQTTEHLQCINDSVISRQQSRIPEILVEEIEDNNCPENSSAYVGNFTDRDIANRRSEPLPRRKLCQTKNSRLKKKMHSYHSPIPKIEKRTQKSCSQSESDSESGSFDSDFDPNDVVEPPKLQRTQPNPIPEQKKIFHKLQELITTEEKYVEKLKNGIRNYMVEFVDFNLPSALKGKKYVIFGNIEQIAEFHDCEILPMFQRYRNDLLQLFNHFTNYLKDDRFYKYVPYAINKPKSDKLCKEQSSYLQSLQAKVNDRLGIISFLIEPIQRLGRYKLFFEGMINELFKHDSMENKEILAACCIAEKNIRTIVELVNEAVQINDIKECYDINILHQGRFKKCDKFTINDYDLHRSYDAKVFMFQKCLIYTEIKELCLLYRGYYPYERIGFLPGKKSFILFNQQRKIQECEFYTDPDCINLWTRLIGELIQNFANDEKVRLIEKTNKRENIYRRPGNISVLSNRNRVSCTSGDSGIGLSINTLQLTPNENSPRTTWYADNFTL